MPWLRFLSRFAFICNLVFLVAVAVRFNDFIRDPASTSIVGIIGYLLVFIFSPLVNLCYLAVLLVKRKLFVYVQRWLVIANFSFLLLEVLYILFINDLLNT